MNTRVPISVATKRGVSWLAEESVKNPVVLTSFSRPKAVVIPAGTFDELMEVVRSAAREIVEPFAERALTEFPATLSLDEVCDRLEVDVDSVRSRARRG